MNKNQVHQHFRKNSKPAKLKQTEDTIQTT